MLKYLDTFCFNIACDMKRVVEDVSRDASRSLLKLQLACQEA